MSDDNQKTRVAPNSKESEMMVLGCMLTSINALNIAADTLDDSDFYYTEHKIIFQVLKTAYRNDKPADIHLVAEELKRLGKLSNVGGVSYLTTLAQYAGTSAYIEEYTDIVRDKSILRKMINAAEVVEKSALDEPPDVFFALDEAQALFFKISQAVNPSAGILLKDLLSGVKAESNTPFLKELQLRQEHFQTKGPEDLGITGIPTHFIDLDKMLNGLNNSNLMILAARPAMGKTALAICIAENICFKNGVPVGIFSLEMSAEQLLHRIICSQAEVESDKIKTGSLNGLEFQRIVAAVNNMQSHTMIIDDQPGLKITDLRARARRMKESHQIGLLIVDYLQLLSGSGSNRTAENRQNEISEISRMLKNLARELNIPVICLSQLSRKVEDRQGHRPMMSDLRESGCLSGDTFIKDAETGELHKIKELAERESQSPLQVYAVDENLQLGKYTMTKVFYSGKKTVYLLKTRTGRSIKASANHPFLKLEGWTALDQLKKGDRVAMPRQYQPVSRAEENTSNEELALIAHLLGDGCILPRQPYHYTSAAICYASSSQTLSKQVQHLLLSIGIQSTIATQKSNKGCRGMYHVHIQGNYNQRKFLNEVGCTGSRGKEIPMMLEQLSTIEPHSNYDVIPKEAWHGTIKRAKENARMSWRDLCKELGTSYCGSALFKNGISKNRMLRLADALQDKQLKQMANSEIYWDEIMEIEELGIEDVYDATVPRVHNFVANDIIVHNSIEQDADIVAFLLRREYYDPLDKPGMAEVIVAKNRHGGVGSVHLTFRKEIAQFANYTPVRLNTTHLQEPDEAFNAFSPN